MKQITIPCNVGDEFWSIAYAKPRLIRVKCTGYVVNVDTKLGIDEKYIWLNSMENEQDFWRVEFEDFEKSCYKTKREAMEALRSDYEETISNT